MAAKLGQLLITSSIISEEQLKQALIVQKKDGGRLGTNLVKLGFITEDRLVSFLSKQYGVPAINLAEYKMTTLSLNWSLRTWPKNTLSCLLQGSEPR